VSKCHPTALPNLRRARIRTCVKSKCGGYGSWYWLVACGIGLLAYLGLVAEAEDFCNPAREHGTPRREAVASRAAGLCIKPKQTRLSRLKIVMCVQIVCGRDIAIFIPVISKLMHDITSMMSTR